jgi:hypothetical protein
LAVPRGLLAPLKAGFSRSARTGLETALHASSPHRDMGSRRQRPDHAHRP